MIPLRSCLRACMCAHAIALIGGTSAVNMPLALAVFHYFISAVQVRAPASGLGNNASTEDTAAPRQPTER